MAHRITLIPGDGIGPEVAEATVRVVEATGAAVAWERVDAGEKALAETGKLLPEGVYQSLARTHVGLKGPTAPPIGGGHKSINVTLRKKLDLYTNFRPVRMLPGLKTRFQGVPIDMIIFRENTEDLYAGLEHEVVPGVVESLKIITRTASLRIARATFQYVQREGRKKVTAVHKANIMKMSDGLFLTCCREVAADFPAIKYEELIVDNARDHFVLESGVQVFSVFAENDHVDRHALKPRFQAGQHAHGAEVGVEIELSAQRDVDAFVAAADGRGGGALEADMRARE